MSELLKISDLRGGYKEGVDILRGIDLSVQEGEAVGIIGLNGSGKSTLGKAIMNMIPIRRGQIIFDGEDVTALSTHELSRKGLSIMQQGGQVFPTLSVWENLELAMTSASSLNEIRDIIPLLQRPKRELQHKMADKLSGGQKHQLALAMTLATNPKLVILDEPSAGLSPKAVEEMYTVLLSIRKFRNISVILIEQKIARAISYCNFNYMVTRGVNHILKGTDIEDLQSSVFKNL